MVNSIRIVWRSQTAEMGCDRAEKPKKLQQRMSKARMHSQRELQRLQPQFF
ncbi:hypothetical protein [Roseofilum casamattae]|uniref:Uncharacterized protein n=1 Tax=Roseofilum casamattae BLCC-M143 TaxID=3022442 RepID=A0ABT7C3S5_9CYAN|nr:hypothetical protein [Roseofilum casamattae]MDJ1185273.1 hypothetical protein [Roseofilum casamattae BLCC-M143]